jgi:hypothetical protein
MLLLVRLIHFINVRLSSSFILFYFIFFWRFQVFEVHTDWLNKKFQTSKVMKSKKQKKKDLLIIVLVNHPLSRKFITLLLLVMLEYQITLSVYWPFKVFNELEKKKKKKKRFSTKIMTCRHKTTYT